MEAKKVKALTVGATYRANSETSYAGKVNSDGIVSANVIQIINPTVKLIASAQVDARNFAGDSHKFGLQLILG